MTQLVKSPVIFREDDHTYWLGDKELHGITSTLIRRAFPDKYADVDPLVLAHAAEKGRALHAAIECFDAFGGDPSLAEDERVQRYADIKQSCGLTTIANEYLVSDNEHYASSVDIVMENASGDIYLVDIKTTWTLDRQSTGLQLSIYKRWFEQQNPGLHVAHICVLWLPNRDHTICQLEDLTVVADETIDELIEADLNGDDFHYSVIPDGWNTLEQQYLACLSAKEYMEEQLSDLRDRMMQLMTESNIASVKTAAFTVSYIPEKTTRRFDASAFRAAEPDLYKSYMKEATSAAQLRVLPKKQKDS